MSPFVLSQRQLICEFGWCRVRLGRRNNTEKPYRCKFRRRQQEHVCVDSAVTVSLLLPPVLCQIRAQRQVSSGGKPGSFLMPWGTGSLEQEAEAGCAGKRSDRGPHLYCGFPVSLTVGSLETVMELMVLGVSGWPDRCQWG